MASTPLHRATPHRSGLPGLDAITLTSGRSFPRHAHDVLGLGVVTEGAQRSWSVLGEVEAGPGDVIMVNPGEMHDGVPLGAAARSWRIAYFEPDLLDRLLEGGPFGADAVVRPTTQDQHLAAMLLALFARIEDADAQADTLIVEEAAMACLARASRHLLSGCSRWGRLSPPVRRAVERLRACPEAPTSLGELAREAGVSRFQLLRGFARQVGASPHAFRQQLRLALVRRHLAAGAPLAEAALLAGFADQSHMTRAFLRQFGVTPGRYRAAVS